MYLEQLQKTVSLKLFCFRIFWVECEKRSGSLTYNFDVLSSFSLISLHRNTRIYTGVPVNFVFATEILFSWPLNVHKNNYSSSRSISTFLPTDSYLRHGYYIIVYVSFSCPDIHLTIFTDWFTPVIPYQSFNIAEIKQKKFAGEST